jgi:UDP-N-acetylglucosamine 2-epimerase (non-hydrolysing)
MKKAKKKIIIVAGARPNFPKVAPIIRAFGKVAVSRRPDIILVHTGQHYDYKMSKVFFEELEIPKPDHYLGAGSGSHAVQTARVMVAFERVLLKEKPELVMVVGDVNSTLACALTAQKMDIKVAHVEAGLRSFDPAMPEEVNRRLTDHLSDYLFVSCPEGMDNLKKEGFDQSRVHYVGNVMIDTLKASLPKAKGRKILAKLGLMARKEIKPYCLVTLHRPSNVDNKAGLKGILKDLKSISREMIVVMALHPRTVKNIGRFKLGACLKNRAIICLEPQGYLDFLNLEMNARLVITDSGGLQEETSWLGVPCITVRDNTERPVTVRLGTNILAGTGPGAILKSWCKSKSTKNLKEIPMWDGRTAERIVKILGGL